MQLVRFLLSSLLLPFVSIHLSAQATTVQQWLTTPDKTNLFKLQVQTLAFQTDSNAAPSITIADNNRYQTMDGFGFALTGGSAQALIRMSKPARKALLLELFGTGAGQSGISYLRLSIGASDLNDHVFSYDDMPAGQTDTALSHFTLGPDTLDVIPVMKEILAINPSIKILASPWSPPVWMKTIADTRGGRLQPAFYRSYAAYFVKYIKAMKANRISIDAVTIQNEPLHPGNNPSLLLTAPEEADFIKQHLGPLFVREGVKTNIILYDHNADRPDYPIFILNDPAAKKFVDGSGFHLYNGKIEALTVVHDAHPDKHIYFTEQMVVDFNQDGSVDTAHMHIAAPVSRLLIGAPRNWSRNVIAWNLAANAVFKPYTDRGGCNICQGAVTIQGDRVARNLAYYAIVHASKFVRPGSVRIGSSQTAGVATVAFSTPQRQIVVIAANLTDTLQPFNLSYHGRYARVSLPAGSAATYVWKIN